MAKSGHHNALIPERFLSAELWVGVRGKHATRPAPLEGSELTDLCRGAEAAVEEGELAKAELALRLWDEYSRPLSHLGLVGRMARVREKVEALRAKALEELRASIRLQVKEDMRAD